MAASPTYTYTFKVEPQMFRRALYFNTFGKQRIQSVLSLIHIWTEDYFGAGVL